MVWVFLAIGLVGGAAAGALIAHSRAESKIASLTTEVKAKTESLAALEPLRAENDQLRVERARTDAEQTAAAERTQSGRGPHHCPHCPTQTARGRSEERGVRSEK